MKSEVIAVETDRVWDTTHITISYSDGRKRIIEIDEGDPWDKPIEIREEG